jgi:hypothetical protein
MNLFDTALQVHVPTMYLTHFITISVIKQMKQLILFIHLIFTFSINICAKYTSKLKNKIVVRFNDTLYITKLRH